MDKDTVHPIIDSPHNFDIISFHYEIDIHDPLDSYIDLTLKKDSVIRRLRFYGPRDLEIEKGFPKATRGMEILDVRERQLADIGVWVADFENSHGSITFWAKTVVDLDEV